MESSWETRSRSREIEPKMPEAMNDVGNVINLINAIRPYRTKGLLSLFFFTRKSKTAGGSFSSLEESILECR